MICVRQDLIDEELNRIPNRTFKKLKLSNRFIDWLFRHYYTVEMLEKFYDSEPDLPSEWENDNNCWENPDFLKVWRQLKEEYEPKRLEFNNWFDPYGEGIWNMSQNRVDELSKKALYVVRSKPVKKDGRLWIAYEDDYIFIYWYGRDFMEIDYWWVMKRG